MLRIVLLLVIAWMTLLVFNSALIVVPISLGRALFNSIPRLPITHGIKCNGTELIELIIFVSVHHNFEFVCNLISFVRSVCIHHWKLCDLDCCSGS